jgi:hypothetical protein
VCGCGWTLDFKTFREEIVPHTDWVPGPVLCVSNTLSEMQSVLTSNLHATCYPRVTIKAETENQRPRSHSKRVGWTFAWACCASNPVFPSFPFWHTNDCRAHSTVAVSYGWQCNACLASIQTDGIISLKCQWLHAGLASPLRKLSVQYRTSHGKRVNI